MYGFTLMEVLIALFIFSILAILTMRGLQTTFAAKKQSKEVLDQLAELEIAYSVIQQDIEQIINRNVLEPNGGMKLAFLAPVDNRANSGFKASMESEYGYNRLEFTRTGVFNTIVNTPISDLQRVAYFLNKDVVVRHTWRQMDATTSTLVDRRPLLSEIEELSIYFIDQTGQKLDMPAVKPSYRGFNPLLPSMELPKGIVFNFKIKQYGDVEWVFTLPNVLNKAE